MYVFVVYAEIPSSRSNNSVPYMISSLITLPSILWFLIKSMWCKAEIQHINQCAPALGTCAQHERSSVFIAASSTWAFQIEESMGNCSFLNSSRTKQLHSLQEMMQPNDIELLLHILASFSRSALVFNSSSSQMENTHAHFPCQMLEPKSDSWQLPLGPHRGHVLGCIEGQCFGTRTGAGWVRAGRWMQMPGAVVSPEANSSIPWVSRQRFRPKQPFLNNKLDPNLCWACLEFPDVL